jgi:hypothetical protein
MKNAYPLGGFWMFGALITWGLYKCVVLAKRRATNKKCVHALAAMLAAWLVILFTMNSSDLAHNVQPLRYVGILLAWVPIVATVLAILGLREIRRSRLTDGSSQGVVFTQGRSQAIGALVLAVLFVSPFAVYGVRLYLMTMAQASAASAPPVWTLFKLPAGDLEVLFPGTPKEQMLPQSTPDGPVTAPGYVVEHAESTYMVWSIDAPLATTASAGPLLDALEKELIDRFSGRLIDRVDLVSDTTFGRELRVVSESTEMTTRARALVAEGHVYLVVAASPEGVHADEIADRFFASITVHPAGPTIKDERKGMQ